MKTIATWCVNTGVLLQERPILPNIDSIGWSRHWTETEWQTWLNLAAVTGMALEVSGDLTKLACDAWLLPTDIAGSVTRGWLDNPAVSAAVNENRRIKTPEGWGRELRTMLLPGGDGSPQVWPRA